MIEIAPSMLAADLLHLESDLLDLRRHQIKTLHFDVMDAHFVPNLSFGPALCRAVHGAFPEYLLDVHLMMDNPQVLLDSFVAAGASAITVHAEVLEDAKPILKRIKEAKLECGISIKPGTDVQEIEALLPLLDRVLVMTVEPGFGGQKFMENQLEKIIWLRKMGFGGRIAVDGGVNMENVDRIVAAGADILVMGTAFFKAENRAEVVQKVKDLA